MKKTAELIKITDTTAGNAVSIDIEKQMEKAADRFSAAIKPGTRIAITVGSRGITDYDRIIRAVADAVRKAGAEPFIIPAMGSHGGATAEGQKQLLAEHGITEETMGAEIISSMETVELDSEGLENRVFMDRNAYESDGVILVNRVKAHTDFQGEIESGLVKMSLIGLGKHDQAKEIHRFGVDGLKNKLIPSAEKVIGTGKILLGVAISENHLGQTTDLEVIEANRIIEREKEILADYKAKNKGLPVNDIDILIVDEFGKNICGCGMDPVLIGRRKIRGAEEFTSPDIKNIIVVNLSEGSGGNALGIGLADYTVRETVEKINWGITYENIITSTFTERGKLPIVAENVEQALEWASRTSGNVEEGNLRIMRIRNTTDISTMYVSENIYDELGEDWADYDSEGFVGIIDEKGNLRDF